MDPIIKNYESILVKPPSTRLYIKFLLHKLNSKRLNKKIKNSFLEDKTAPAHTANTPPVGIEIMSFAIVVDDVVVDIMNVQKDFGEVLQKSPKFILIDEEKGRPRQGWIYKDNKFIHIDDLRYESKMTVRY